MKQTTWEEKFRKKFGRFYYSDSVGIHWEKPTTKNVTGTPIEGSDGFCIASDDIEQFIKDNFIPKEEVERWIKENGKDGFYDCGVSNERGYNQAVDDLKNSLLNNR